MEENNKQHSHTNTCDMCGRNGNMCYGCNRFHILRWILGIIIITWIFSAGVKFGELKAALGGDRYEYSRNMMYGDNMMYGRVLPAATVSPTTVTSPILR